VNGDFVYRGREVSDDVYPYAIPTSNPDIVISPFALNNLVDVTGIPSGARLEIRSLRDFSQTVRGTQRAPETVKRDW